MNPYLKNAILSMDAYNRGYNASINTLPSNLGASIGDARIVNTSSLAFKNNADRSEGFYALAYDTTGDGNANIIAYRGTDYPKPLNERFRDPVNGWTLGGGDLSSTQGQLAVAFYQRTVGPGNWLTSDVTLTGHSLGGGLAGFVGALYNKEVYTYDTMTFELAASKATNYVIEYVDSQGRTGSLVASPAGFANFSTFYPDYTLLSWEYQNPEYVSFVYGGNSPIQPDYSRMRGLYVNGEALEGLLGRGNEGIYDPPISALDGIDLLPDKGFTAEAIARHSQSTLVILLFSEELPDLTKWSAATKFFWPVMYDDDFAQSIGMTSNAVSGQLQLQGQYADILRTIIAYSAIDEGEDSTDARPFGDTGIRALYSDANDLGAALESSGSGSLIETFAKDLSEVFVRYAGQLALGKVLQSDESFADAIDGVLTHSEFRDLLTIDLSEATWNPLMTKIGMSASEMGAFDQTVRADLVKSLVTAFGEPLTAVQAHMEDLWDTRKFIDIEEVMLATAGTSRPIRYDDAQQGTPPSLFLGTEQSDNVNISSSFSNAIALTGDGEDRVRVNSDIVKNVMIDGGEGADTITFTGDFWDGNSLDLRGGKNVATWEGGLVRYNQDDIVNDQEQSGSATPRSASLTWHESGAVHFDDIEKFEFRSHDFVVYTDGPSNRSFDSDAFFGPDFFGRNILQGSATLIDYSAYGRSLSFDLQGVRSSSSSSEAIGSASLNSGSKADQLNDIRGVFGTNNGDIYYITPSGSHITTDVYSGTGDDVVYGRPVVNYFYTGGTDLLTTGESTHEYYVDLLAGGPAIWVPGHLSAAAVDIDVINVNLISESSSTQRFSYDLSVDVGTLGQIQITDFRAQTNLYTGETTVTYAPYAQVGSQTGWYYNLRTDFQDFEVYEYNSFKTVLGSAEAEVFRASKYLGSSSVYRAHNGDDVFYGKAISEIFYGGAGDDIAYGRDGDDELYGGLEGDSLYGGLGNDILSGGEGDDHQFGGSGDDHYIASGGRDIIDDTGGLDSIYFGHLSSPKDLLFTKQGSDLVVAEKHGTSVTIIKDMAVEYIVFANDLALNLNDFEDWLAAGEDLILEGSDKADSIGGNNGSNLIYGRDGADILNGGPKGDQLFGGKDLDTASYEDAPTAVTANLHDPSVNSGEAQGDGYDSIEGLIGSRFDDKLWGNHHENEIHGGDGDDQLWGGLGYLIVNPIDDVYWEGVSPDFFDGGDGTDRVSYTDAWSKITLDLIFGANNRGEAEGDSFTSVEQFQGSPYDDKLRGDHDDNPIWGFHGNDQIWGRNGDDRLFGQKGDDVLRGGKGADRLVGDLGNDTADYTGAGEAVTANLTDPTQNTGDAAGDSYVSIENLIGSIFSDTLIGDANDNDLLGGDGNDLLSGGLGADFLDGGAGRDTADHSGSATGLKVNLSDPTQNNGEAAGDSYNSIDNLRGSSFDDLLYGDQRSNKLSGGDGNDSLFGGKGADKLEGGDGLDRAAYTKALERVVVDMTNSARNQGEAEGDSYRDIENLYGSAYDDVLRGDNEDNAIWGFRGDDVIWGRNGDDRLFGQDGDDLLRGGAGEDVKTGGAGNDIFEIMASDLGKGIDTFTDFEKGADKVDLSDILDGVFEQGVDRMSDFIRLEDYSGDTHLSIDQDGGGDSFVQMAIIQGVSWTSVAGFINNDAIIEDGII